MTPPLWKAPPSFLAKFLSPLGLLYGTLAQARNQFIKPHHVDVPVICVGNISLGGAGKTPTVIALAKALADYTPHILSRGYRGRLKNIQVDPTRHTFKDVGDEPLLLARHAPTWVGADRRVTAIAAIAAGAKLLILDDGFQNPLLHKDFSLVVVDGSIGFGNGLIFPAGPLRESIEQGLHRASAVLVLGEPSDAVKKTLMAIPTFHAKPEIMIPQNLYSHPLIAFAGLAYPEKFFNALKELTLVDTIPFPDHHSYSETDLERLKNLGYPLITTEKDFVRLPPSFKATPLPLQLSLPQKLLNILKTEIQIKNENNL